jgi:hypothetical protein
MEADMERRSPLFCNHNAIWRCDDCGDAIQGNPSERIRALAEMLDTATTRLEVALGRMRACRAEVPDAHAVSMLEIPAWIEEQRRTLRELITA